MEHGHGTFRVTLSMRKEPEGGPVFCKMEQTQRFKQLKTVKLHTETTYRIDVSFKPPRSLQALVIQGQEMEACERARDSTACAYSTYYTTEGLLPSRKGTREDLCIIMNVLGSGELSTCLQTKLYKARDTQHCEWGSRLHCIELDCTGADEEGGVRVERETYRAIPSFTPDPSPEEEGCCAACSSPIKLRNCSADIIKEVIADT